MTFVARNVVGPFGALEIVDGDRLWCAYLEADPRPGRAPDALARLLADAAAAVPRDAGDGWPTAMAGALDSALRQAPVLPPEAPTSALFAAALVTPETVSVCTAGDLRIHLLCDGKLSAVTHDHVWASDPPDAPPPAMADLPPEVAVALSTRWLGGSPARPPESALWPITGRAALVICSSQIHRHRPPAEYLPSELASPPASPGLLVIVEL